MYFGYGEIYLVLGGFVIGFGDDVFELLLVFVVLDGVEIGVDEFYVVFFQYFVFVQCDCGVQCGLFIQGCQQGVDFVVLFGLLGDNLFYECWGDGFYVGVVGEFWVGYDGGWIRVYQVDL